MTETILGSSLKEEFELLHFDNSLNERLERIGRVGIRKGLRLWKQYRRMGRILRDYDPDLTLIPLSQTTGGFIKDARFVRLAKKAGSKVIAYLHGGELDRSIARSPASIRPYMKRTLEQLDGAIVLGDGLRRIFQPYLPEERIFTVPNGLEVHDRAERTASQGSFRILFLSNPMARKGIEELIDAVGILHGKGKVFRLDVVGEWFERDLEQSLKRKVEQQKLPVNFHGPLEEKEKEKLFQRASLFVLPSNKPEGLPVAIIEALGHGFPILSTAQGAIPDAVKDGWNGQLILPRDPVSLSEKIERLMEDPERLQLYGKRSRELYEAHYTEERLSQNLYHCFERVLKHPPRG